MIFFSRVCGSLHEKKTRKKDAKKDAKKGAKKRCEKKTLQEREQAKIV